jgi:hypothetical protein
MPSNNLSNFWMENYQAENELIKATYCINKAVVCYWKNTGTNSHASFVDVMYASSHSH